MRIYHNYVKKEPNRAKIEIIGRSIDSGLLDWSYIVYSDGYCQ